jgi:hypothetical protein
MSRSTAKGNILVMNNKGMTSLTSDTSGGNIEVQNNASISQVMSNNAAGHLDCSGNNASMVGDRTRPANFKASASDRFPLISARKG